MTSDKPEVVGFVGLIDLRIAALQQFKESLIAGVNNGLFTVTDADAMAATAFGSGAGSVAISTSSQASVTPSRSGPIELPTGVFRGMGLSDAIRAYLGMAKRKQTNREIKGALMEGGLATTSDFFDQTLSSTLHRMRKSGELLQFKDGWDLASSYHESFRQRMAEGKEPASRGGAKKKRRKKVHSTEKPAARATQRPLGLPAAKTEEKASTGTPPVLRAV